MPLTFSHPAITLPLTYLPKRFYSLTGLVIGSMTPDFEYFLRMKLESDYSHTLPGIFWFDLPVGLFFAFVFHNFVRESLLENLPLAMKSRLASINRSDWNPRFRADRLVIMLSIIVGAASHIFWDGFTHYFGIFAGVLPILRENVHPLGFTVPVFKILQHTSTIAGAIAIIFAIRNLPVDESVTAKINFKYWGSFAGLALLIFLIRFAGGYNLDRYGDMVVSSISSVLLSLIIMGYFWKALYKSTN